MAGRDTNLHGPLRITASRIVSHYLLPPVPVQLGRDEPGIEIELSPTDASDNLLFREADIALRMYRPTQPDLITAHLCDIPMAIYAAHSYLAHSPDPITPDTSLAHEFVGFDRSDLMLRMTAAQGFQARREDFPTRCAGVRRPWFGRDADHHRRCRPLRHQRRALSASGPVADLTDRPRSFAPHPPGSGACLMPEPPISGR